MSSDNIPKHQLLVKLLKMTTSNTDAEALVAIRKANALLTEAGWDWEKLMTGKIVVVGDPFANLKAPPIPEATTYRAPVQPTPRPSPPAPPPVYSKKPTPQFPLGIGPNKFEGHCYCCGRLVAVGGGFFFKPSDWHHRATSSFKTTCTTCNTSGHVGPSSAPRQGPGARKVTADDLA